MLRKLMVVAALAILPAMAASAQFSAGDWELTLSGQGSNGPDFDGTAWSVDGQIGYFLTKELEVSLRQTVTYTDIGVTAGGGSAWAGASRIAADWNFDMGRWVPYIGANIGYVYGDGVHDSFEAGPEAGIKFFVNSTTFIRFGAEYEFFFDNGSGNTFSDGQFIYGLGIGFRWH
ncbi:MAG TPA: hypothetical protein VH475_27360 [Tepidisphaeraceae bacterium]|jgi:hypothetical protein